MALTRDQITSFHNNGYLAIPNAIPVDDLDNLITDFNTLIDDIARTLYDEGAISDLHESEPFDKRIASLSIDAATSLFKTPHGSGPNLADRVRWSMDLRWHDARKPGGRPLPGMLVRNREHALTAYEEWVAAWEHARADTTPRKLYRWEN